MGCLITGASQSQVLLSRLHVSETLLVGLVGVPVTDMLRQAVRPSGRQAVRPVHIPLLCPLLVVCVTERFV